MSKRVEKARVLLARLQMCVRRTWGLKPRVVKLLWKGAVEPILLNGVGVWAAALKRKGVVKALRGVQRMFQDDLDGGRAGAGWDAAH